MLAGAAGLPLDVGRGVTGTDPTGIDARRNGHLATVLRTSRVTVLLVAVAVLGLLAGVLWGSAERLADRRDPVDRAPVVVSEQ